MGLQSGLIVAGVMQGEEPTQRGAMGGAMGEPLAEAKALAWTDGLAIVTQGKGDGASQCDELAWVFLHQVSGSVLLTYRPASNDWRMPSGVTGNVQDWEGAYALAAFLAQRQQHPRKQERPGQGRTSRGRHKGPLEPQQVAFA